MTLEQKFWTEETSYNNDNDNERTALLTASQNEQYATTPNQDFRWLLKKGSSIAGTILLHQMMELTNISMIGHLGARELAAATLGNMLLAVVYYCIAGGIANTMETLCSQAYTGAKDKTMVGVYFQRVYSVLIIWSILMGIVLYNGTSILIALGQEPELAAFAGSYIRCIFPGAIIYVTFDAHRKYLQSQGETIISVYILMIGVLMNALIQYFLIFYLNMGFIGAPFGLSIVYIFMLGAQLFYTHFIRQTNINCWGGWSFRRCLPLKSNTANKNGEWFQFFNLIICNVFVICSEYYVAELSILAISYLPNSTSIIASGSVLLRSHISSHTVAIGLAAASATRVGHHIGQGSAQGARQSFHMGCWVSLLLSLPLTVFFWLFRDTFPYLFTEQEDVAKLISTGLPLLASYQVFGMIAGQLSGVLRGFGRQQISAFISLITFYGVTVPVGYTLIFHTSYWSLNGIWVAFGIGYFIYALAQLLFLFTVDWTAECAKIQNQLLLLHNSNDNHNITTLSVRKDYPV
ncbi:mate-domain-containing protein [Phascolomyces articulosus]|uniref:Mate-domain-containing protein n=1 Tax=Phascolomyces articulosus TaxID=60185 RepID=A0AAD5JX37_9FUNG|nr:mate-domain-containing protein [Phascolomyces articulosus]